jgi:tetratricopeptide (TPR) repeat protein
MVALGASAFVLLGGPGKAKDSHGHEGHDGHGHEEARPAKVSESAQEVVRLSDRAARATATGDRVKAREALAQALKVAPDYAPALLVQACLALDEGNELEAGAALERLVALAPRSPEVQLLERLRELRKVPGTSWQQAFREAWVSLGRPDLQKSKLLPGAVPLPPDPADAEAEKAAWERATSDDTRLVLALAARRLDEARLDFLLKQVPRLEDPALYLAVMDTLRGVTLPEAQATEAAKAFRAKLEALAKAHPDSLQLQLLLLLGDTEQGTPMSAAELDALEKLVAMPAWRTTSFAGTYQQARQRLVEAGVADPSAMAMAVAMRSINDRGTWVLRTRNIGTRGVVDAEGRKRLGRLTRELGARLAAQSTLMERMTGLQLTRSGAQDMQDEVGVKLAVTQMDALEAGLAAFRKTAMVRWPLHGLTEELMAANVSDETGYLLSYGVGAPAQAAGPQP